MGDILWAANFFFFFFCWGGGGGGRVAVLEIPEIYFA